MFVFTFSVKDNYQIELKPTPLKAKIFVNNSSKMDKFVQIVF